jgi:hypothetical protein
LAAVDLRSIRSTAESLQNQQVVPLANSHLNLMATYLSSLNFEELCLGSGSTFSSSLLNFIPRALYPDKGETTGVKFARMIFPEWFREGEHSASLTVGLPLDFTYNFGVVFAPLLYVLFIALISLTVVYLERAKPRHQFFSVAIVWVGFFDIFFDDLGGVVNKLVLIFLAFLILSLITRIRIHLKARDIRGSVDSNFLMKRWRRS